MTVLRSGSATDVGRVRTVNQDMALETPTLFAVADGMGGHAGGEVAAQVAVEALEQAFARESSTEGLRRAVDEANSAVWRASAAQATLRGMGTTLTAAALVSGKDGRDVVALANVGDSRAYLYSGGRITQVTTDHSLAEEKVRHGELTEAEAAVHPHRHILTRALGVADGVDVDVWELHVRTGDRILICSDGLTNEVGANQLTEVLGNVPDPAEAARSLVNTANEHGGNDNITVVVVDVLIGEDASGSTVVSPVGRRGASVVVAAGAAAGAPAGAAPLGAPPAPGPVAPREDDTTVTPAVPGGQVPDERDDGTGPPTAAVAAGALFEAGDEEAALTAAVPAVPAVATVVAEPSVDWQGEDEPEPGKESRRQRRRRLGIPRRVTFRVLGFFLLIVALAAAAYGVLRWYANDSWYVTLHGNQVVIYRGQQGGVLWFNPKIVDRTGVTTDQIQFGRISDLRAGVVEPSMSAARRYVANLRSEFQETQSAETSTTISPFAVGPSGTIPAPPASTTTTFGFGGGGGPGGGSTSTTTGAFGATTTTTQGSFP